MQHSVHWVSEQALPAEHHLVEDASTVLSKPACRRAVRIPRKPVSATRVHHMAGRIDDSPSAERPNLQRTNLTGVNVLMEVRRARASCDTASLFVSRYEQTHAAYLRDSRDDRDSGTGPYDLASKYIERYECALDNLESIEIETVPAQAAFADRTIFAEIESTRTNVKEAVVRCRSTITKMMQTLSRGNGGTTVTDLIEEGLMCQLEAIMKHGMAVENIELDIKQLE